MYYGLRESTRIALNSLLMKRAEQDSLRCWTHLRKSLLWPRECWIWSWEHCGMGVEGRRRWVMDCYKAARGGHRSRAIFLGFLRASCRCVFIFPEDVCWKAGGFPSQFWNAQRHFGHTGHRSVSFSERLPPRSKNGNARSRIIFGDFPWNCDCKQWSWISWKWGAHKNMLCIVSCKERRAFCSSGPYSNLRCTACITI